MLKSYAELGYANRCDPCVEYPGTWMVFRKTRLVGVKTEFEYLNFEQAHQQAKFLKSLEDTNGVSIYWKASDGDPRIGKTWFSSFYEISLWDKFGKYIRS